MYYIMGEKLNVMRLLKNVQFNPMKGEVSCNMYDSSYPGWGGRLRKASHHLITSVLEDEIKISDIIDKHYKTKITNKDRSTIIKAFPTLTAEQRFIPKPVARFMTTGDVRALLGGKATKTLTVNFLKMMLSYAKELYGVEVDTSVTGDVRRLLRMPGGINIKQGYPCMEISKDALEDVDLLFFLCESVLGHEEVEIKIDKPIKVQGYEDFTLDAGIHKLPMCKAMLALCQS
jgi:DNA primase catalytic subunit